MRITYCMYVLHINNRGPGALYELCHTAATLVNMNICINMTKCYENLLLVSQKWSKDYVSRYVHLIHFGGIFMEW